MSNNVSYNAQRRNSPGTGFDEGGLCMKRDRDARMPFENSGTNFTRRALLQRAGWIRGAAAFTGTVDIAAEGVSPVIIALSNYMSDARKRELPDKVLQETKHHI